MAAEAGARQSLSGGLGRSGVAHRFLQTAFKLRPGELGPTLVMFGTFFSLVGAFIIGRAVRDTLFLAELPASKLAPLYIVQSFALGIVSYTYALVAQRVRRDRLIVVTPAVLGGTVLLARALLPTGTWILYVLYLWIDVIGTVAILEFWTFANELYHARDGKRLFGLISAGSTVANIFTGIAVTALAPRIGAKNLLFLCAGLLLFAAALGTSAARRLRLASMTAAKAQEADPAHRAPKKKGDKRALIRIPHVIAIVLVVTATYLTITIVDFQFKAVAAQSFGSDSTRLAEYFGNFYSVSGVVSLVVQLAITGRLLDRFGVVGTLAVLPLLMTGGSVALIISPMLWAATMCKGSEAVLRYTVNDAGMQLLFMPLSADVRGRAKALIEGIVKPGAQVLAGTLVLVVGARSGAIQMLSTGAVLLTAAWLFTLMRLRMTYVGALRETLRTRRARLVARDERALSTYAPVVARELRDAAASDETLQDALEIATTIRADLSRFVAPLLRHKTPLVRKLACEYVASRVALRERKIRKKRALYKQRFLASVLECLDDQDKSVRAAAIAAHCALVGEEAISRVTPLLEASYASFSAAALAGVVRFGGDQGIRLARRVIERFIADDDPLRREEVADALRLLPSQHFSSLLLPLFDDPELRVARAAVIAAGDVRTPDLISPLIVALSRPSLAREAGVSLTKYGVGIEQSVNAIAENEPARAHVPGILSRLNTAEATVMLTDMLETKDETIRRAVCKGFSRRAREAKRSGIVEPLDHARLTKACLAEIEIAYRAIAAAEAVEPTVRLTMQRASALPNAGDPGAAAALLVSSLLEKRESALDRAFFLLQVLFPAAEAEALRDGVRDQDATRRANALEILDTTLRGPVRQQLLPLVDETPRVEKIAACAQFYALPEATADAWIAELLDDANAWVRACAAHYAGATIFVNMTMRIEELLHDDDEPIVRESALAALENLVTRDHLETTARAALKDTFLPVRRRAEAILMTTTMDR